mgnify:FL=1
MITTFSDALREMDRNTKVYMVEQLAKEVQEKDHALAEKDNTFDISILLNYICHFSKNAHRTTFLFPS